MRTFNVVIERDPDTGLFVGHVPGWPGAHSQGESLDELQANLQEVASMLLEDGEPKFESEFVGPSRRDISPTLLRKIATDIGVTADQLIKGNRGA
jgi:predicted RNase H-like HicB family nuclease